MTWHLFDRLGKCISYSLGQTMTCRRPEIPADADIQPMKGQYSNDDIISYSCLQPGQVLSNGNSTRRCINGKWTGTTPVCKGEIVNPYACRLYWKCFACLCKHRGVFLSGTDVLMSLSDKEMSWLDAESHCKSFGARLLSARGKLAIDSSHHCHLFTHIFKASDSCAV